MYMKTKVLVNKGESLGNVMKEVLVETTEAFLLQTKECFLLSYGKILGLHSFFVLALMAINSCHVYLFG